MKAYKIVNPITGTEKSFETLEQAKKIVENYYYKDFNKDKYEIFYFFSNVCNIYRIFLRNKSIDKLLSDTLPFTFYIEEIEVEEW